ncbi:hypothetical protein FB45DRAFT_1061701 [Roridomyces roridus]|uniref:BHLH domain-containing protein n=1 Tax=Roridomyces roridus TaxID=1738132 RepID=A0AAD7FG14_9AGAR|nr:hypothetical protein FB45DRAFT_1061701 [Roridomyces roridus]
MPHSAPPSPSGSSTSESASSISSAPPLTPPLAFHAFMNRTGKDTLSPGGVKRIAKSSRRNNSAERRATHNAVERARREVLNARFLDLAAVLSNLQHLRRPTKSAIVNSSIAHLAASRRHRIMAAQQLRVVMNEVDALRYEVNQWRRRAGVPLVEEPRRGDAFGLVLRGELEFEPGDMLDVGEDEEDSEGSGNRAYPTGEYAGPGMSGCAMNNTLGLEPTMVDPRDDFVFGFDVAAFAFHPAFTTYY